MLITVGQASEEYFKGAISKSKLYELVRQKKIPVVQISSRKIYFDTNRLDRWLEEMDSCKEKEEANEDYGKLRALKP